MTDPYLCSLCWRPVLKTLFIRRHDGTLAHVRCYAVTFGRAAVQIPKPPPIAPLRGESVYSGRL